MMQIEISLHSGVFGMIAPLTPRPASRPEAWRGEHRYPLIPVAIDRHAKPSGA